MWEITSVFAVGAQWTAFDAQDSPDASRAKPKYMTPLRGSLQPRCSPVSCRHYCSVNPVAIFSLNLAMNRAVCSGV